MQKPTVIGQNHPRSLHGHEPTETTDFTYMQDDTTLFAHNTEYYELCEYGQKVYIRFTGHDDADIGRFRHTLLFLLVFFQYFVQERPVLQPVLTLVEIPTFLLADMAYYTKLVLSALWMPLMWYLWMVTLPIRIGIWILKVAVRILRFEGEVLLLMSQVPLYVVYRACMLPLRLGATVRQIPDYTTQFVTVFKEIPLTAANIRHQILCQYQLLILKTTASTIVARQAQQLPLKLVKQAFQILLKKYCECFHRPSVSSSDWMEHIQKFTLIGATSLGIFLAVTASVWVLRVHEMLYSVAHCLLSGILGDVLVVLLQFLLFDMRERTALAEYIILSLS